LVQEREAINQIKVTKGPRSLKLKLNDNDIRRLKFLESTMGITHQDDVVRYCLAQVCAIVSASQAETASTMFKLSEQHEKPSAGAYGLG
jgi:hypothetical protein